MALAGEVRGIVFVDAFAYGANNGTDWFHAYNSLKTAVEMSPPGSEIWVAEGVYYATALNDPKTDDVIALKPGMRLYGGFRGWSLVRVPREGMSRLFQRDPVKHRTIIEGRFPDVLTYGEDVRSTALMEGAADGVLDGFTLRNAGRACAGGDDCGKPDFMGGALRVADIGAATQAVVNCVFLGNAGCRGSAIYVDIGSLLSENNAFTNSIGCTSGTDVFVLNDTTPKPVEAVAAVAAEHAEPVGGTNVWNGVGDCRTAENWSLGIPAAGQDIVVASGEVSLDAAAPSFGSLTVGEGAALRLVGSKAVLDVREAIVLGEVRHEADSEIAGPHINVAENLLVSGVVKLKNAAVVCGGVVAIDGGRVDLLAGEETGPWLKCGGDMVLTNGAVLNAFSAFTQNPEPLDKSMFEVDGSIYWPNYLGEGTVYTRSIKNMPLAENSRQIAEYMPKMPEKWNGCGVITSYNTMSYNLPVYIVDSTATNAPRVRIDGRGSESHRRMMFSNVSTNLDDSIFGFAPFRDFPLEDWSVPAFPKPDGDVALGLYDIGTGIVREYFLMTPVTNRQWRAAYGGYYPDMWHLPRDNYACQHKEGSDFVVAMLGALGQVGIEEARRGEINHAIIFTAADAKMRTTSWPARQNDGRDPHPHAPAQGQWFRFPPDLDVDALKLRPLTRLLVRTAQKHGGFASDKNWWCHAFNFEPGIVEAYKNGGQDPWLPGGDLYEKYGELNLNDFPWELTEWAPIDWGKPADPAKPGTCGGFINVGGTLKVLDGSRIHPHSCPTNGGSPSFMVGALEVDATGAIAADGLGFAGGRDGENGAGLCAGLGGDAPGGGGHGGRGGGAVAGETCDDIMAPTKAGSGGGASAGAAGGSGGGVVWIEAWGSVRIDGRVGADGMSGERDGGGGAGGSVFLVCNSLSGIGTISANGAPGSGTGAGGGGGRISMWDGIPSEERARNPKAVLDEPERPHWYGVPWTRYERMRAGDLSEVDVSANCRTFAGTVTVDGGASAGTVRSYTLQPETQK